MSNLHLPVPMAPGALDPEKAPNGSTPRGSYFRRAADAMNSIATYHKKLLQMKCQHLNSIDSGGAPVLTPWEFYFRTGENTNGVRCILGMVDTDYVTATAPTFEIEVHLASDGTEVAARDVSYNGRNDPGAGIRAICRTSITVADLTGLAANTEYYFTTNVIDGARLAFLTVHEIADRHADDSVTGVVDPTKFATDGPIYDEHVLDLLDAGDKHWRHGGCHYLSWNPPYGTAVSLTATSYTNLTDETSTTYSAATPGFTIASKYHGTATTGAAGTAVKIAVKGNRSVGVGNLSVRLFDGTNSIAITGITVGGQGDWYTGTATIPSQVAKWDVQGKVSAGTFDITAVSVFAYTA